MLQLAINDHEQLQALRGQMGAFDWKALLAKLFPALSAIPQLAPLIAIAQAILALLKVLPQPSPSPSPTPGDDTIPPVPLSS